jgi:hypothetical protein
MFEMIERYEALPPMHVLMLCLRCVCVLLVLIDILYETIFVILCFYLELIGYILKNMIVIMKVSIVLLHNRCPDQQITMKTNPLLKYYS